MTAKGKPNRPRNEVDRSTVAIGLAAAGRALAPVMRVGPASAPGTTT